MVEKTLDLELQPGGVYISGISQKHMAEKHPADYSIISNYFEAIIMSPSFIGQAPQHANKIEFVKRILILEENDDGKTLRRHIALMAVSLERDDYGDYRVLSGYLLKEKEVTSRRAKGRLKIPKK